MKLVYFAHPLVHYGTHFEVQSELKIYKTLPEMIGDDVRVFNPNQTWLERVYQKRKADKHEDPFSIFTEIVTVCDIIMGSTFLDGKLGAGVFTECKKGWETAKDVFLMVGEEMLITEFSNPQDYEDLGIVLTIEETRERIKDKVM